MKPLSRYRTRNLFRGSCRRAAGGSLRPRLPEWLRRPIPRRCCEARPEAGSADPKRQVHREWPEARSGRRDLAVDGREGKLSVIRNRCFDRRSNIYRDDPRRGPHARAAGGRRDRAPPESGEPSDSRGRNADLPQRAARHRTSRSSARRITCSRKRSPRRNACRARISSRPPTCISPACSRTMARESTRSPTTATASRWARIPRTRSRPTAGPFPIRRRRQITQRRGVAKSSSNRACCIL